MRPWVVLGVAGSKRSRGLRAAAQAAGRAVQFVEWRDWLGEPAALERALQRPCWFKIEPPGDDAQVHLGLLHLGCVRLGRLPCLAPGHGELLAADAWFAGFAEVMARLSRLLSDRPHVQVLNAPEDILAVTDKLQCQQQLRAHHVPTAPLLGPVSGHDEFMALLDQHGLDRVFLKARYGSSAAGVVAYRRNARGQQQATTSACLTEDGRLFNVKRLRRYERPQDVRQLVDRVAAQAAYVEAWLPKPRCGRGHFDVRVVTLAGQAAHRVARVSTQPMTNLHLDSRRADPAGLLARPDLQALEATSAAAAAVFARSQVLGLDLVVQRGAAKVIEVNAFGDLLPGLLWQGHDTYGAALRLGQAA